MCRGIWAFLAGDWWCGSLSGVKLSFSVQPLAREIKLGGYVMRIPRTFPLFGDCVCGHPPPTPLLALPPPVLAI